MRIAQRLDPLAPIMPSAVGGPLILAHRYPDAIAELRKGIEMYPAVGLHHEWLAMAYLYNDNTNDAALLPIGLELSKSVDNATPLVGSNVTTIDQPDSDRAGAKMIEMLSAVVGGADPGDLQVLWQPVLLPGTTVGRASC